MASLLATSCIDGGEDQADSAPATPGDGVEAVDDTVLGASVAPAELVPGERFTLSFPGDTVVGPDFVMVRGDEPLHVLGAVQGAGDPTVSPPHERGVLQRGGQLIPDASGRIVVELLLPGDAQEGDELCIDVDTTCSPLPIIAS